MDKITISKEKYLQLLRNSKVTLEDKLSNGFNSLRVSSLTDCLIKLSKLNEWNSEYQEVLDQLDMHEPKITMDDIPF